MVRSMDVGCARTIPRLTSAGPYANPSSINETRRNWISRSNAAVRHPMGCTNPSIPTACRFPPRHGNLRRSGHKFAVQPREVYVSALKGVENLGMP